MNFSRGENYHDGHTVLNLTRPGKMNVSSNLNLTPVANTKSLLYRFQNVFPLVLQAAAKKSPLVVVLRAHERIRLEVTGEAAATSVGSHRVRVTLH